MSSYIGDFAEDSVIQIEFNTNDADGTPATLSGTPVVSVYKSGSTTESTAGVTLTADYDSRTGYNVVVIDTSADAFFEAGKDYTAVITTGTVDGVSVVGVAVGKFSIENRVTASVSAPTVEEIVEGVLNATLADYDDAGSVGEAIAAAGSAGDPWITALPGSYSSGQAGHLIGNILSSMPTAVWSDTTRTLTAIDAGIISGNISGTVGGIASVTFPSGFNNLTLENINSQVDTALADYDGPTNAEMVAAFTEIKGAGWASGTDTLEKIADSITGGGVDLNAIAEAVWDWMIEDIVVTGSIGAFVVSKGNLITSAGLQVTGIPAGVNNVIELYKGDVRTLSIDYNPDTNNKPVQTDPSDNGSLANYKISIAISKLSSNTNTFTGAMTQTQIVCDVVDVGLATQGVQFMVDTALWVPSINPWASVGDWVKGHETYAYQWELVASNGHDGTAQAGSSTTITLAADAAGEDDFYNGRFIQLTDGTGADPTMVEITDYVGSTKVATVAAWAGSNPDSTTVYKIHPSICEVIKAGFFHVRQTSKTC